MRRVWLYGAAACLGLLVLWVGAQWSARTHWRHMWRSAARAMAAAEQDAEAIRRFRSLPVQATAASPSGQRLNTTVERIARQAGIPKGALVGIEPRDPVRVGRSAYKESTCDVVMRGVAMRQLAEFLYTFRRESPGFHFKELRLMQGQARDGRWDVRLVLACVLFEPATPGRS